MDPKSKANRDLQRSGIKFGAEFESPGKDFYVENSS